MAAKSKKRPSKIDNKLENLEQLQLKDVICSICQSILVEPVTLPCYHNFCHACFNGSIENNALCCPLCRLRIGSWLRTTTKLNTLVNNQLWNFINTKFSKEIELKLKGDDIQLPEGKLSFAFIISPTAVLQAVVTISQCFRTTCAAAECPR